MIAMNFTIELDIGALFPSAGCSATATDRSRDGNSSSWAVQAIVLILVSGPWQAGARLIV